MRSPYGHEKEILLEEKYNGVANSDYKKDCARLDAGEPLGYVMGFVNFLDTHVDLSYHPMIPRFETAFWVKRAIEELKQKNGALRIADTFSGSGCVGLAIAKHIPNAHATFSEFDPKLKTQIELSLSMNNVSKDRYEVFTADSLDGLAGVYDAIVANPPYIDKDALPTLDKEMIEYEPHMAFIGQSDGRNFHKEIIERGWSLIKNGGSLYMEADSYQHDSLVSLLKNTKWTYEFWEDPYGATPFIVLRKNV